MTAPPSAHQSILLNFAMVTAVFVPGFAAVPLQSRFPVNGIRA
jgi:hypothetical protein